MANLEPYKAMLQPRSTSSYGDNGPWDAAEKKLHAALDDAVVARREAEAMSMQMTEQARHVAQLEFEVVRLTTLADMKPQQLAWDDPRSHRDCGHADTISAYRKCFAEGFRPVAPPQNGVSRG